MTSELVASGFASADDLTPQKARILLSVLLGDIGPQGLIDAETRAAFTAAVARAAD